MAVRRAGEGSRGGGGFLERLGWVAGLNFCVNALLLEETMIEAGFKPYSGEWWHFSDTDPYEVEENFTP